MASCGNFVPISSTWGTVALNPCIWRCRFASMATGPEKVMSTGVCMNCMREGGGGGSRPTRESTLKVFLIRGIRFSFWSRVMMGCKRVACSPCMA